MRLGRFDWGSWVYGLAAAFISGGSGAVTSGFVVAFKDPKDYAMGSSNFFQLVFAVFIVQGTLTFFATLHQRPLPEMIRTETLTEKTVDGGPKVVTRTVEEKVVGAPEPPKASNPKE